jgi:hypothetical protein
VAIIGLKRHYIMAAVKDGIENVSCVLLNGRSGWKIGIGGLKEIMDGADVNGVSTDFFF